MNNGDGFLLGAFREVRELYGSSPLYFLNGKAMPLFFVLTLTQRCLLPFFPLSICLVYMAKGKGKSMKKKSGLVLQG